MICDKRRKLYVTRVEQFMKRLGEKVLSSSKPLEATFGHSVDPVYFDKRLGLDYSRGFFGTRRSYKPGLKSVPYFLLISS